MAKGKRISEQPIVESLSGDELIPFAKNGANGAVTPDTIKEFAQDGLDTKYATIERVNDLLDGFAPKSHLVQTDQEVSRINDALIAGLNDKVDKVEGKGLSSNDFTDEDKAKLDRFELVLANEDEIENGLLQIASSEDYRNELKERGYVVYYDVKFKVKDCGVDSDNVSWIVTEGEVITTNEDGTHAEHTQENILRSVYICNLHGYLNYQSYDTPIPVKVSELTNDSKYQTETQVENRVAILSDVWDAQLEGAFNNLDNKKVDKVTGKQLSTEDFTTLLKSKLEQLAVDVPDIDARLTTLQTSLDTILDSDNATAVIDTFQEIENFLQGVTNTQTLTGLLQEMKSEIVQLCADTYLPKSGGTAGTTTFSSNKYGTQIIVNRDENNSAAAIKYTNKNEGVLGSMGIAGSNTLPNVVDKGDPYYENSAGQGYKILHSGNYSSTIFNGTSSQFLKADGSVDATAYLPTASYTASDVLDKVKSVDGAGSGLDADLLDGKHATGFMHSEVKGNVDFNTLTQSGAYRFNKTADSANSPDGYNYGQLLVIHGGDDTIAQMCFSYTTSGRIAVRSGNPTNIGGVGAWGAWKTLALTTDNVASADKLTTKQLTNEDLNDLRGVSHFNVYSGLSTGITTNNPVPSGFSFYLQVYGYSGIAFQHITDMSNNRQYIRHFEGNTWSAWVQMATVNDAVAKLTTKQLTNEDLNTIKDANFSSYYAASSHTCANVPTELVGRNFQLNTNTIGSNIFIQILFGGNNYIYKRIYSSNTWTPWKKFLFEDDLSALAARVTALENQLNG